MSNECRYHAVGSEVFYKGERKVRCYDESDSKASEMAEDVAKHLNEWLKTLEWLDGIEKGAKHGKK